MSSPRRERGDSVGTNTGGGTPYSVTSTPNSHASIHASGSGHHSTSGSGGFRVHDHNTSNGSGNGNGNGNSNGDDDDYADLMGGVNFSSLLFDD